jgi:phage terminase large subunit
VKDIERETVLLDGARGSRKKKKTATQMILRRMSDWSVGKVSTQ